MNKDKFPKPQLTKSGHKSVGRDVSSHQFTSTVLSIDQTH